MKDFLLAEGFLQSCVDLPRTLRRQIVSTLQAFAENPRERNIGVLRVEDSKNLLLLPIDDEHSIILHRRKAVTTLLSVAGKVTPVRFTAVNEKDDMVIAPVDAIETLLVEEKYLPLARHFLEIDSAIRELRFQFADIEKILNAHLPPEARRFPNWWANQKSGKRPHSFAWTAPGWMVSKVDIKNRVVTFRRKYL